MRESKKKYRNMRLLALFLCAVFIAHVINSVPVSAETETKLVRVGWYESSYNTTDDAGRRSGYAYEYQMKIASYTGWKYEYVTGSWSELMQMLQDGKIDLMSDVSYTDERAENMLFPSLSMGTEEYYVFTTPDNTVLSSDDYSTFNGKKIGTNKGSIQADLFRNWAEKKGITPVLVELMGSEEESLGMLAAGELDGYITPDAFADPMKINPVVKIGSSDYYFAVNKDRPDILEDLEKALNSIQDEDRYFNQLMSDKYILKAGANAFVSTDESAWIDAHGPIRVGYQDNYMAFCDNDDLNGQFTGALKDCLDYMSDTLHNAKLEFEPVAYPTAMAAIDALNRGEIDCMFPANLSGFDCELMDVSTTHRLMRSDIFTVVRRSDQDLFADREHVIVAVDEGNPNYDNFLLDNYPDWRTVYYKDTDACLKAVSKGVADCFLISSYRYSNLERDLDKYDLTISDTGKNLDFCFAVANDETELYSILTKAIGHMPDSSVNSAISMYISEEAKSTFADMIKDNVEVVVLIALILIALILTLLIRSKKAEKLAQELISATESDKLTGLYNRDFFFEYANRMYRDHPDRSMDAIVINIEQFHSINALSGRDFGDQVLRVLGKEIYEVAKENKGIAGRFGADRFDIYCRSCGDCRVILDRLQSKVDSLAPSDNIRLRMGVMHSQPDTEPVQLFDMACTACSMARGNYKEHLVVFNEDIHEREMFEQLLMSDLRRALDTYQFEVFYQPKYDISSEEPELVSAEALVRWNHPDLGFIAPVDFIPLLERNGMISELDKYVWEEAARQIVRWREMYGVIIPVSVNLSRVDVFDPELENILDGILKYNGLEPDVLKLEVTETAYTEDAEQVINVVEGLRSKGFIVEMDDFGTGYSSLNMLSAMPVDVIKMDREFVRNIEHNEKDIQLVALILNIAKQLNIPVIAEGVETESQLKLLKKLGCEVVQGYYFSQPLPATEFEEKIIKKSIRKAEN